jgi:hypothetical protein
MPTMWVKIAQHRAAFLVGVLVVAVVLAALVQVNSLPGAALLALLLLGLLVVLLLSLNAGRPATFLVRAGTFTSPPDVTEVLSAALSTVTPVALVGFALAETPPWVPFETVVLVLMVLLLPLVWYRVLGPFGVSVRPDGLFDRQPFGSLLVPWEAGPAAEPTTSGVRLRMARPELVVRRGFRPGTSIGAGADRGFAAWAINLYAARPDLRPPIGTDEGLHGLSGMGAGDVRSY